MHIYTLPPFSSSISSEYTYTNVNHFIKRFNTLQHSYTSVYTMIVCCNCNHTLIHIPYPPTTNNIPKISVNCSVFYNDINTFLWHNSAAIYILDDCLGIHMYTKWIFQVTTTNSSSNAVPLHYLRQHWIGRVKRPTPEQPQGVLLPYHVLL